MYPLGEIIELISLLLIKVEHWKKSEVRCIMKLEPQKEQSANNKGFVGLLWL